MHIRFIDPNRLTATGTSYPDGRSNNNAGPPPGAASPREYGVKMTACSRPAS